MAQREPDPRTEPPSAVPRWRGWSLLALPSLPDEEETRKARLLIQMVRGLLVMAAFGTASSMFESANRLEITLLFYGAMVLVGLSIAALSHRGQVRLAGWLLTSIWWTMLSLVPLLFGGLQGENVSNYPVLVLLAGVTISGRVGVLFAGLCTVWLAVIAWLELTGRLPQSLTPYSPVNAFNAAATAVILSGLLLRLALGSLEASRERERRAAAERDTAQRRAHEAQQMELVGNITAAVAHDFNNLLTVMVSAHDALRFEQDEGERTAILDDLNEALGRASLLARHLLMMRRSAGVTGSPEVLDMGQLIRTSTRMLPRLLGPSIHLEVDSPDGPHVRVDRVGLEQTLLNLAVNARDAMSAGGTLRIRVSGNDTKAVLTVEDTGSGMDEDTRQRLFEPFFTTKSTGTGLGLSTVHQFVTHAGGKIDVSSRLGDGTSFRISFPRAPATCSLTTKVEDEPAAGLPVRVLLVEDDPVVARGLRRVLERARLDVLVVTDGDEALAVLGATRFDVVVSDVAMRRVGGVALAHEARRRWPDLPLVLISGTPPEEGALPPGVRCIEKPFEAAELLAAIQRLATPTSSQDAPPSS